MSHWPAGGMWRSPNAVKATINWRFSTQDARTKLHRLYPFNSKID